MSGVLVYPTKTVTLRCECGCTTVVFDKYDWNKDGSDVQYSISFQDDYIYGGENGIIGRIKRAVKILFGKPIYYAEVDECKENMGQFLKSALKIVEETTSE